MVEKSCIMSPEAEFSHSGALRIPENEKNPGIECPGRMGEGFVILLKDIDAEYFVSIPIFTGDVAYGAKYLFNR